MINNLIKLPGGVGDQTPTNQIDPIQLSTGIQIEMEHTNDLDIAKEIAMDHLTEDPKYYSKLVDAGLASEFKPGNGTGFGDSSTGFNDSARIGAGGLKKGNMHGKIGNTPDGRVDGRRSEPVVNKTIDIELEEQVFNSLEEAMLDEKKRRKSGKGKRKPKPTNPALWARAKSAARSKFDVYPSAYANGWAAKWYKSKGGGWRMSESYPARAMESPFPADATMTGSGTNGSGYDFVGYAENKQTTMNKQQLKEAIKRMIREMGSAGGEAEAGDQQSVGDITPEQSNEIDETKQKWIQKAIHPGKKGALKKALDVPTGQKIPSKKLAMAAKKGGKLGQRARLAMTLRKLKESF